MSMDEPHTCGKGLAERSALPARLSALAAAIADMLERHQQTLDLTDDNARAEHTAYQYLASDYRDLTSQLRATADRMVGYRDLPMARHHADAMVAPEIREALASLVQCERDVAAIVEAWIEEDQAMLAMSKESP
jgi:hypothetical protein